MGLVLGILFGVILFGGIIYLVVALLSLGRKGRTSEPLEMDSLLPLVTSFIILL